MTSTVYQLVVSAMKKRVSGCFIEKAPEKVIFEQRPEWSGPCSDTEINVFTEVKEENYV